MQSVLGAQREEYKSGCHCREDIPEEVVPGHNFE